jgi:ribose/xylose/arabinose/galactoside ABC-type transport system permease subunit
MSDNSGKPAAGRRILGLARGYVPWFILLVLLVGFSFISPNFLSATNLVNILNQNAYLIVCAIGVSFFMLSAQIDLSIGYQISLIGVCAGLLMRDLNAPFWAAILGGILVGIAINVLIMLVSIKMRIELLLVSVGSMTVFRGLSLEISGAKTISAFDTGFKFISQGNIGPAPFAVILALVLVVAATVFLTKTYWGRFIYAVGGNAEAARLSGINVAAVRILIGALAGFFIGLSSIMLVARVGTAHSNHGPGTEITVIIGILLGGVSISGGAGKLPNVVAGVLVIGILGNGMQLAGMGNNLQFVVKGLILLAALGIDMYQKNRKQKIRSVFEKEIGGK